MKLLARPKSLAEATARLVTVVRLLGLRAFEFRGRPRYVISLIYLLILYTIYCCSLHVQHTYYSREEMLKLESVLYKLLMYLISTCILVKLLLGWWYTEKYKSCYQNLSVIDETLRQLGVTSSYDKLYFTMLGLLVLWIVLFLCGGIEFFIGLQRYARSPLNGVYAILIYTYRSCIDSVIVMEFFIIVKCIRMKFESINRLLWENLGVSLSARDTKLGVSSINDYACIMNYKHKRHAFAGNILTRHRQKPTSRITSVIEKQNSINLRVQSNLQFQEETRSQQQEESFAKIERRKCLLQTIKQVHLELCKISKTLCSIVGVQIALEIGINIMFLTQFSYTLYSRYVKQYKQPNHVNHLTKQMITRIMVCIRCMSKLMLLCACKTTADEGNKTIEIIHATYDENSDLTDEIQQFGIQILQSPVAFTAIGLPLDNAILTMTLKFITTYLVIMIQVSNSLESDKTIPRAHL